LVVGDPAVVVKLAVELPPGTVTEAGTLTHVLFDMRATTEPLAGAGAVIVTVHVEFAPDSTLAGEHVRLDTAAAVTVSDAAAVVAFSEAVTIAD
jgi:hypothetical protein